MLGTTIGARPPFGPLPSHSFSTPQSVFPITKLLILFYSVQLSYYPKYRRLLFITELQFPRNKDYYKVLPLTSLIVPAAPDPGLEL